MPGAEGGGGSSHLNVGWLWQHRLPEREGALAACQALAGPRDLDCCLLCRLYFG